MTRFEKLKQEIAKVDNAQDYIRTTYKYDRFHEEVRPFCSDKYVTGKCHGNCEICYCEYLEEESEDD